VDDDIDDPFISNNRVEELMSSDLSSSQSLETPVGTESAGSSRGATEMTSGINEVNSPGFDRPHTPPHQIRSISENQVLALISIFYPNQRGRDVIGIY